MQERYPFYIDGRWVEPVEGRPFDVIDPSTEAPVARIALGGAKDVDRAATAARQAFESYSQTSVEERRALLERILGIYERRCDELAERYGDRFKAPNIAYEYAEKQATFV